MVKNIFIFLGGAVVGSIIVSLINKSGGKGDTDSTGITPNPDKPLVGTSQTAPISTDTVATAPDNQAQQNDPNAPSISLTPHWLVGYVHFDMKAGGIQFKGMKKINNVTPIVKNAGDYKFKMFGAPKNPDGRRFSAVIFKNRIPVKVLIGDVDKQVIRPEDYPGEWKIADKPNS